MKLNDLDIYMEGLAVHLAYQFRPLFRVWSDISDEEQLRWRQDAKSLMNYLKKQKTTPPHKGGRDGKD